jgi:hypothetical protein
MSGGHFDYSQHKIREIADSVEQLIIINGKELPKRNRNSWDDETHYYEYPPDVIEKFKEGLKILRQAEVYAQRIDWLVSGDDGEESFLRRLESDLNHVENKPILEKYESEDE